MIVRVIIVSPAERYLQSNNTTPNIWLPIIVYTVIDEYQTEFRKAKRIPNISIIKEVKHLSKSTNCI